MIGPDVVPTHIIHDDSADLHRADLHLISDLFWMGRLIADPDAWVDRTKEGALGRLPVQSRIGRGPFVERQSSNVSSSADCAACGGSRVFHGELCPQCT